jgi:hypothetical protein
MLFIDMTTELSPILYGMNVLLFLSALAVLAEPASHLLRKWTRTFRRPRLSVGGPAVGHSH